MVMTVVAMTTTMTSRLTVRTRPRDQETGPEVWPGAGLAVLVVLLVPGPASSVVRGAGEAAVAGGVISPVGTVPE